MGFVTNEEIHRLITEIQDELAVLTRARRGVKAEMLVEELSISKAAKLIHTSTTTLVDAVKRGELRALAHPRGDASKLRFRVIDLLEWQEGREVTLAEREKRMTKEDEDEIEKIIDRARKAAGAA